MGEHDGGHEPEHHQGKILRRSEPEGKVGERRSEDGQENRRDSSGEERPDGGRCKRLPGLSLTSHLVAVERGDDA